MKKTLIIEKIDDFEVVRGVGRLTIDPARTHSIIKEKKFTTPEYKNFLKIVTDYDNQIRQQKEILRKKTLTLAGKGYQKAIDECTEYKRFSELKVKYEIKRKRDRTAAETKALADAWEAYNRKKKEIWDKLSNTEKEVRQTTEYKRYIELLEERESEVKKASLEVTKSNQILMREYAVFFHPKAGEEVVDEKDAKFFKAGLKQLPKKTLLLKNGDKLLDRRGEKYYFQDENGTWKIAQIEKLAEELPETAVFVEEMTLEIQLEIFEQKEEIRLVELSEEESLIEFENAVKQSSGQAVREKGQLEIEGETPTKALSKARKDHQRRVDDLKVKYNIKEKNA